VLPVGADATAFARRSIVSDIYDAKTKAFRCKRAAGRIALFGRVGNHVWRRPGADVRSVQPDGLQPRRPVGKRGSRYYRRRQPTRLRTASAANRRNGHYARLSERIGGIPQANRKIG